MRLSRSQNTVTAWVLTASILLYPLLSYLVTPAFLLETGGRWTVVCTLKGLEHVYVDGRYFTDSPSDSEEYCPALKLVQLAGSAYHTDPPRSPGAILYSWSLLPRTDEYQYRTAHVHIYSTRAPPGDLIHQNV